MAQYEKLINLSLLSEFLAKAKTIFAPKITASGILKGDGNGGVTAATAGTDYATPALVKVSDTQPTETENKLWVDTDAGSGNSYQVPTVAESLAMGVSGAKVGDLVRVNSVDENGKPTSWKHVPLNEIKCNKNLLDNWYFVGGGSQLGDGVFPINQRGQTTYSDVGYGIDRWKSTGANRRLEISSDGLSLTHDSSSSNSTFFVQILKRPIDMNVIKTLSILDSNGNLYTTSDKTIWVTDAPFGGYRIEDSGKKCIIVVSKDKSIKIAAIKLELGSEQTLAHNEGTEENPVWVLNEVPYYGEELAKCQRYYQLFRTESLCPTYGEDCRPTMATNTPTKSTITKNGVTYYTLSSET